MRKRRFNLTNILFAGFSVILLVLTFFSYQRSFKQAEASEWVTRSQTVKLKLEEAYNLLINAETSQRGYLLTKDISFLDRLTTFKKLIPQKIADIEKLIADNPQQVASLQKASHYFDKRLMWLQMVIDTSRQASVTTLIGMLSKGQNITDTVVQTIGKMKITEDALLKKRLEIRKQEEASTAIFILLFSLFCTLFLAFAFFRLKRESTLLAKSQNTNEILEQKVQERTARIKLTNDILEAKNRELQQRNDQLNSFTFIASHDLKEPLRKIEMYSNRLIIEDERNLSAKGKDFLEKLRSTTYRMQTLLNDIFMYAEAGEKENFVPTELDSIVQHSINTLQEIISEKQAIVEWKDLPTIPAIPYQMEALFTNIIGNALKYAKEDEKPHIVISADYVKDNEVRGCWKISFTDNGIGFDETYKEKIFEIFQRLHSKTEYAGTGIGLAICKRIAENHGGDITASSTLGKGAIFTLTIPDKEISHTLQQKE